MISRVTDGRTKAEVLSALDPLIAEWFDGRFADLTEPQALAIPLIEARKSVLVSSPTGSGKTLTAFLSIIDRLYKMQKSGELEDKIYAVYISPLKALANDINKNLLRPISELTELAKVKGQPEPKIRVAVRTGDTSTSERQRQAIKAPHILSPPPSRSRSSSPRRSSGRSSTGWNMLSWTRSTRYVIQSAASRSP